MNKYMFYQTQKTVGMCPLDKREKYSYKKKITPIRYAMLEITTEAIDMLLELFIENQNQFTTIINDELDWNFNTLYSN